MRFLTVRTKEASKPRIASVIKVFKLASACQKTDSVWSFQKGRFGSALLYRLNSSGSMRAPVNEDRGGASGLGAGRCSRRICSDSKAEGCRDLRIFGVSVKFEAM